MRNLTPHSEIRNPHSTLNSGFALLSMIIILSLLGIATGVAASFAHRLKASRRQVATEDKLKALKEAILGNPREYSKEGRSNFGYLGDMGGLPAALADLYTKGTQPDYGLDATTGQGRGWAGPYITTILREDLTDLLKDPYGNTYDYTTTAYQRASDNEWVSARIRSFGPNKTDDGGTGDDRQVEILRRETRSTVSVYVTYPDGTAINGATVTLYRPVNGSAIGINPDTISGNLYTFTAGTPNATDVPYGIRTITASTAATAGKLQYAPNSALAINNNNLSFNITNWGAAAAPVPVTSIRLDYTFTGYYQEVWIGCPDGYNCTTTCPPGGYVCQDGLCKIFDYTLDTLNDALSDVTNPRAPTGTTLTFPTTTISGGSTSSTTRILVASDSVQPPNIVLSPRGGTLNIRYLTFMQNQTGGGPSVGVNGKTFTVTLNNGATVVLTATFTAHEED